MASCSSCGGSGRLLSSGKNMCVTCDGTGLVRLDGHEFNPFETDPSKYFGTNPNKVSCPSCGGSGSQPFDYSCPDCGGSGVV